MANYFRFFPTTFYTSDNNSKGVDTVTSIVSRFTIANNLRDNTGVFYPYDIQDTDTAEIIASKIYGNPERHWIVLSFNQVIDPQWDFPLTQDNFISYVNNKYTANGANDNQNLSSTSANSGISTNVASVGSLTIPFKQIAANNLITSPATQPILTFDDRISLDGGSSFINVASSNTTHITLQTAVASAVSNNTLIFKNTPKTGIIWALSENNIQAYFLKTSRTINAQNTVSSISESESNTTLVVQTEVDKNTYANTTATSTSVFSLVDGSKVKEKTEKFTQSYYTYEFNKNEEKRKIKILKPEFVTELEKEFRRVFTR